MELSYINSGQVRFLNLDNWHKVRRIIRIATCSLVLDNEKHRTKKFRKEITKIGTR